MPIIKLEIFADGTTYGEIVDRLLEAGAIAVGIDTRTVSSASSPTFTLDVPDSARHAVARCFGHDTWAELVADRVDT